MTKNPEVNGLKSKTIPENAPTVMMDVNLGKKFGHVEFDYDEFGKLADEIGVRDAGELKITLTDEIKRWRQPDSGIQVGEYSPKLNWITLAVDSSKSVNKNLSHELQHAADHASDPEEELRNSEVRERSTKIFKLLGKVAMGVSSTVVALRLLGPETANDVARNPALMTGLGGSWAAMKLGPLAAWRFNPSEIRARKSERKHGNSKVIKAEKSNNKR